MADNVNIDPRYMRYDKADVERILGSVEHIDDTPMEESDNPVKSRGVAAAIRQAIEGIPKASEEDVRSIVRDWAPKPEPESEPEP